METNQRWMRRVEGGHLPASAQLRDLPTSWGAACLGQGVGSDTHVTEMLLECLGLVDDSIS